MEKPTNKRRRSLFEENDSSYTDKLNREVEKYIRVKEELDETVAFNRSREAELITEMKNTINVTTLSKEKQEFLNKLPDVNSYIHEVQGFLCKYEVLSKEMEAIKTAVIQAPRKYL